MNFTKNKNILIKNKNKLPTNKISIKVLVVCKIHFSFYNSYNEYSIIISVIIYIYDKIIETKGRKLRREKGRKLRKDFAEFFTKIK